MPLSHEAAAIIRGAALDAMTRELTAEDVFAEVLRLVREADTPEKLEAIGRVIGEIKALAQMILDAAKAGAPLPDPPAVAATGEVADEDEPAEAVAVAEAKAD